MDVTYAILLFAGAVGFLLVFTAVVSSYRINKYKAAWAQLSSMIGGTFSSKSGLVSIRYKISGHYQGMPVEASIELIHWDEGPETFTYQLRITTRPGRQDWKLAFKHAKAPATSRSWAVSTGDERLGRRLIEARDLELLTKDSGAGTGMFIPLVIYKAAEGTLEYTKSVDGPVSVPAPDEFIAQFNVLKRLAELNEKLNAS